MSYCIRDVVRVAGEQPHGMAAREKLRNDAFADDTGTAGHEDFHDRQKSTRGATKRKTGSQPVLS